MLGNRTAVGACLLLFAMCAQAGSSTYFMEEQKRRDEQERKVGSDVGTAMPTPACMIPLSTENTTRYVNAMYVREVSMANKAENGLPNKVIDVSMAGNYRQGVSYSIIYPDNRQALAAMQSLVQQINNCKQGR